VHLNFRHVEDKWSSWRLDNFCVKVDCKNC